MQLTFWGATEDVTGSMTYVHMPDGLLAIDSGLNQGTADIEELNNLVLPFSPRDIKAIILTHAHLDHCGYLPILVKNGMRGPIYCSKATAALAKIILYDSASLRDQDLYHEEDVSRTIKQIQTVDWNDSRSLLGGSFKLLPAGHILGAASVKIFAAGKSVVFSGDLGRSNDPLIRAPDPCPKADAVVMESTYGGKLRHGDMEKDLYSFLVTLSREGRKGIIASFAVARGQLLISLIYDFFRRHPSERIPVVMDSPMMTEANHVFESFADLTLNPELMREALDNIRIVHDEDDFESIVSQTGSLLVISSSGMLNGGRIHRYLTAFHHDPEALLFLPGYQGKGTTGRNFLEGKKIFKGPGGTLLTWRGGVLTSEAFSSHADQHELLAWSGELEKGTKVFLIHGEPEGKEALKRKLEAKGLKAVLPFRSQTVQI